MGYQETAVTALVYIGIAGCFLRWRSRRHGKLRKYQKAGLLFFLLLNTVSAAVFFAADRSIKPEENRIARNENGKGTKQEEVLVTVEGICEREPLTIRVSEQGYTDKEIEKILAEAEETLEQQILGKNQSLERVTKDLNLASKAGQLPVTVQWKLDSYQYMDVTGKLKADIPAGGQKVRLQAELVFSQGNSAAKKRRWEKEAILYPPEIEGKEETLTALAKRLEEADRKQQTDKTVKLPEEIAGHKIRWEKKSRISGYQILAGGTILFLFFLILKRQKEEEKKHMRKEELIRDYPEILEQLSLLIGAGMTVRNAWYKIVEGYQERREETGRRTAYEEMERTCFEMQGGVSEGEGYENFGRRCRLQEYMRLGLLLSQNLRKGTKGLTELLGLEAVHAFEERKARAKKKGEEAGTKLLAPMIMMLAVVLIIVIVPAFWSMGV